MILLKDIVEALELADDQCSSYAHRATGEVRTVTDEELRYAEDAADTSDFPEWQREAVQQAREIIESDDWLRLPSKYDINDWQIMNDFAHAISDARQRGEVIEAIHGSGAFRMFRTTIRRLGIERLWSAHRARALEDIARSWLRDHDLAPGT